LAEQQTAGRGRRGRIWASESTENIYLSLVWPFLSGAETNLNGLGLGIGVAIARVLSLCGVKASLKWPNDVLVNGNKIAGILIESRFRKNGEFLTIIGVGFNYFLSESLRNHIGQACTDLTSCCDADTMPDRNQLAGLLIKNFIEICEDFSEKGVSSFIDEWYEYDICLGSEIVVQDVSGVWTGKALGLNKDCALRVLRDGEVKEIYAADVSVRVE
jgi:BirA family biotin operon repressor/biotin-[acetyl-CoA-carboxylase] ligase